jgi:hypothetical protein
MLGGIAERVHQPHRARFLAPEREGGMKMEDADGHGSLWRGGAAAGSRKPAIAEGEYSSKPS